MIEANTSRKVPIIIKVYGREHLQSSKRTMNGERSQSNKDFQEGCKRVKDNRRSDRMDEFV